MATSQAERLLALLQANRDGVCVSDLIHDTYPPIHRPAWPISDLRKEGWTILTEKCDKHPHRHPDTGKRLTAYKYRLVETTPGRLF